MSYRHRVREFLTVPLLIRELTEQAARKRTYAFRVLYAAIVFTVGLYVLVENVLDRVSGNPLTLLGQGNDVFNALVVTQYAVIYCFLPAFCSGLITGEKERDTLSLLLITRLGPLAIVLEKVLSRLVPFATLLVMSLPVMAIAYSFGGISQSTVWLSIYLICIAAVQVAALSVACSAWFRTPAHSFVGTYVVGFVFFIGPTILHEMDILDGTIRTSIGRLDLAFLHFPPYHQDYLAGQYGEWFTFLYSWPILLTSVGWIFVARRLLITRAFAPQSRALPRVFGLVDKGFERITGRRLARGRPLPDVEPIAWRETTCGVLGNSRYQLYAVILLIVSIVLFLWGYTAAETRSRRDMSEIILGLHAVVFVLAVLILCSRSTALFAGEWARQTLDVLLTSPVTNAELLLQKFRGLRNLIAIMMLPFLTLFAALLLMGREPTRIQLTEFVLCHILTLIIYSHMIVWLGVLIGIRFRRVLRALIMMLVLLIAWCLIPPVILIPIFESRSIGPRDPGALLVLISPVFVPTMNLDGVALGDSPWAATILNSLWYGGCWWGLRYLAFRHMESRLGRLDEHSESVRATRCEHSAFSVAAAS